MRFLRTSTLTVLARMAGAGARGPPPAGRGEDAGWRNSLTDLRCRVTRLGAPLASVASCLPWLRRR